MRIWRIGAALATATALMLCLAAQALASGITNSSEDLRTGWYPGESAITPELVKGGTFGEEWSTAVDGQVYAQPLLYDGTLLAATEQNHVYGLNPATGAIKWEKTLPHGVPWNPAEIGCADLTPAIGVTATPVIDTGTGIAYLTHRTFASGSSGPSRWYMDAISVATGEEQPGFPVEIGGEAQNIKGVTFNPTVQLQRPGLLLMNGVVYAGFGSDCDYGEYEGWVFGVSEAGTVKARWASSPADAGIWQSGAGLTSDGPGTILLATGNGYIPEERIPGDEPPEGLGQSVVRLRVQSNGELKATEFFAPYNAEALNTWDADFGSGGVTGLPAEYFGTSAIPDLAVVVGKDGYVYLLDRNELGGFGEGPGGEDKVVQRIGPRGGVWSRPGVWPGEGGWVYIPTASGGTSAGGSEGSLDVYSYGLTPQGAPALSLAGSSAEPSQGGSLPPEGFGFSTSAPVITSNGTEPGSALVWLVWAPNGSGAGAQLRAYLPAPEKRKPVLVWSAPVGDSAKFAIPGLGLGRLYVGTRDEHVIGFGSPVTPALTGSPTIFPTTVIGSSSERKVKLRATEAVKITKLASGSPQFKLGSFSLPRELAPGEEAEVPLEFQPAGAGQQAASLEVTVETASPPAETLRFSLSGSGEYAEGTIEGSPTVLTLPGTSVGEPVTGTAEFHNGGATPVTLEKVVLPEAPISIEPPGDAPKPGEKIESQETIRVPVSFDPTEEGEVESSIQLTTTSHKTATVVVSATAASPGELSFSPESIDFGEVAVGSRARRTFAVYNKGGLSDEVTISKPPVENYFHAATELNEGTEIPPHGEVIEEVEFAPRTTGRVSDVWQIAGKDNGGRRAIAFTGTGVAASSAPQGAPATALLSPPPGGGVLGFGPVPLASLAATRLDASARGAVTLDVRCPAGESFCKGTVALRTVVAVHIPGRRRPAVATIGTGAFDVAGGHARSLVLKLTRLGRELLSRHRLLAALAVLAARDAAGHRHTATILVHLRAPSRHR